MNWMRQIAAAFSELRKRKNARSCAPSEMTTLRFSLGVGTDFNGAMTELRVGGLGSEQETDRRRDG